MLRNKFIVLLFLLGLQCCLSTSPTREERNLFEESLSTLGGATLLLFSTADGNFTIPSQCLSTRDCIVNYFKGKNLTQDTLTQRLFVRGVFRPRPVVGIQRFTLNDGNDSIELTVLRNTSTGDFNYAVCGVYPACSIRYLFNDHYSFTCDRPLMSFAAAMGIILSIIIIVSNVMVITVTLRTKSLRKPHGFFKLSLAVADLIAGVFILPSIVHNTLNTIDYDKRVYSGEEVAVFASVGEVNSSTAIFFGVMGILSTITAVYSLLLLAIDRFISVQWPMKYRIGDVMNSKRATFGVVFIWSFSLLVAFLPILAKDALQYGLSYHTFMYTPIILPITSYAEDASPSESYAHAIVYSVIVWGLPFCATWILTILTSVQSRGMLRNMREARRRSVRSERNLNKVDRDLIRTVVVVLVLFTLTVLPVFGVTLAVALVSNDSCTGNGVSVAFFAVTYVFICGRFLNVLVYNVFNKEFRTASAKFLSEAMDMLCCYRAVEVGLPKRSASAKKSSTWGSKKSKDKWESKDTKETRISARSPSASTTVTTTDKGFLSPGVNTSKLSSSSVSEETSPTQLAEGNSVFTLEVPKR